jgi:hypothetical protein
MKKLIKILIVILVILLTYICVSALIYNNTYDKNLNLPVKAVNNKDWTEQINNLQTKLKQDASINVLEGTMSIEKTYKNEDTEGKGNRLAFLKKKLAELKSRSLYISTKYKFGYAFDLSDLRIEDLGEGNIRIDLYRNDLYIKYIEELGNERQIKDEYGIFAKDFSANEISTMLELTKVSVQNTINNNGEIRDKAMIYTKSTIENIAKGFGFKGVEVNIIEDNLINNDEVEIKSIDN